MTRTAKFWLGFFVVFAFCVLLSPLFLLLFEDPFISQSFAYGNGGLLHLGYDYIGRPILPQLLVGGKDLLLASLLTALISRVLGLLVGVFLANHRRLAKVFRFFLDVLLVIPSTVAALAAYDAFSGSVYAVIPITTILSIPFTSRYYESNVRRILDSTFYEYAQLKEKRKLKLLWQEIIPILSKNILTDMSSSFISSIYMISSVSFISSQMDSRSFLWPKMVSENLSGFSLNPWASLAPLLAIVLLSAPLSFFVDAIERGKT
ncbi:MAG: ABC transporter permease subunit [Saccharofermentanales bacterium]|jgi:peptide/nickel transport system permease protein